MTMWQSELIALVIGVSLQAAAKFTPLQCQQLIALRAKFLRDIDEVVAERRTLTQGIKVTAWAEH